MTARATIGRLLARIALVLVLLLLAGVIALWLKPPDIMRVGANYAAKIVCSNVFLAGREPDEVLRTDVQAPGIRCSRSCASPSTAINGWCAPDFLGFIGNGLAVERPGMGCTVLPDGILDAARRDTVATPAPASVPTPRSRPRRARARPRRPLARGLVP